jgi:hypothetical protein
LQKKCEQEEEKEHPQAAFDALNAGDFVGLTLEIAR